MTWDIRLLPKHVGDNVHKIQLQLSVMNVLMPMLQHKVVEAPELWDCQQPSGNMGVLLLGEQPLLLLPDAIQPS